MADLGIVQCIHGEQPGVSEDKAEQAFLPILSEIASDFPELRIVLEHISTRWGVFDVGVLPANVAGTITPHHLWLSREDVFHEVGSIKAPWLYCKPTPKSPLDRAALISAATSGNPKFFAGTDSAPHWPEFKALTPPRPGVFCEPTALETYTQVFEMAGKLHRLGDFLSVFGAYFYGLPLNEVSITLNRTPRTVPTDYDGIVPSRARETIPWQVQT